MSFSDFFILKVFVSLIILTDSLIFFHVNAFDENEPNVFGLFKFSKLFSYEASNKIFLPINQKFYLQVIGCVSDGFSDDNCSQSDTFDTTKLKVEVTDPTIDDFGNWRYFKFQDVSPFVNFTIQNYSGTPSNIFINAKATIWKQDAIIVANETFKRSLLQTASIREDWNTEGQIFAASIAYKGYSSLYRIEGEFVLNCGKNFYGCTCQTKCDSSKVPHGYCNQFGQIECNNTFYPREENLEYCKEIFPNLLKPCQTQCDEPKNGSGTSVGMCFQPCGEKFCYSWKGYFPDCTKKNCTWDLACNGNGDCKDSSKLSEGKNGTFGFFTCKCNSGYDGPRCENKLSSVSPTVKTLKPTKSSTAKMKSKKSSVATTAKSNFATNTAKQSKMISTPENSNLPEPIAFGYQSSLASLNQQSSSDGMPGYAVFLLVMLILVIVGLGFSGYYYSRNGGWPAWTRSLSRNRSESQDNPIRYNHQSTTIENPNYAEYHEAGL